MTDTQTPAGTPTPADLAASQTPPAGPAQGQEPPAQATPTWEDLFKDEDPAKVREALDNSRKWEQRAKDNKAAADALAEQQAASMTAEQKAEAAEQRAVEAEARALRREIALDPLGDGKHTLSPADIALLDATNDEEKMRALAKRLATPRVTPGPSAPLEGNPPSQPPVDPRRAFVDGLVASSQ